MKRIILLSVILFVFFPGVSTAETINLDLADSQSGGVSVFTVSPSPTASPLDVFPAIKRHYVYGFQLTEVTVSPTQQAAGGNYDGSTYSVYVKFKNNNDVPWSDVEPVYLIYNERLDSGATPTVKYVFVPPTDLARFFFVAEGVTEFGSASAAINASTIPSPLGPMKLRMVPGSSISTLAITSTSTAVSLASGSSKFPIGTQVVKLEFEGETVRIRTDGTAPTSQLGAKWEDGTVWYADVGELSDTTYVILDSAAAATGTTIYKTPLQYSNTDNR